MASYNEIHHIVTEDNLKIALHQMGGSAEAKRCLIIAPGFAQAAKSENFILLARDLATPDRSVLCLDMRGTGNSEGRYSFGGQEHLDVLAALKFARQRYESIDILGFSLGAYSCLRAAAETAIYADRLFLVSCPTSVEEIIFKGSIFKHCMNIFKNPSKFKDDGGYIFRWGNPLSKKTNVSKKVIKADVPIHFLAGKSDLLIPPKMSKKVFHATQVDQKSWTELDEGLHADLMYIENPSAFKTWLEEPGANSIDI